MSLRWSPRNHEPVRIAIIGRAASCCARGLKAAVTRRLPGLLLSLLAETALAAGSAPLLLDTLEAPERPCDETRLGDIARTLQRDAAAGIDRAFPVTVSVCKPLPGSAGSELFAVAFHDQARSRVQLAVGISAVDRPALRAWHVQPLEEDAALDALRLRLRLDTARYALADGVRAFGVDIYGGYFPHCSDTSPGASRTLYAWKGRDLWPVLNDVLLSSVTIVSGDRGRCSGGQQRGPTVLDFMHATIAIARRAAHGWREVVVTEVTRRDDGSVAPRLQQATFRFDGRVYRQEDLAAASPTRHGL